MYTGARISVLTSIPPKWFGNPEICLTPCIEVRTNHSEKSKTTRSTTPKSKATSQDNLSIFNHLRTSTWSFTIDFPRLDILGKVCGSDASSKLAAHQAVDLIRIAPKHRQEAHLANGPAVVGSAYVGTNLIHHQLIKIAKIVKNSAVSKRNLATNASFCRIFKIYTLVIILLVM